MEWQPIETCPDDGSEFLAYDPVAKKFDVCTCTWREMKGVKGWFQHRDIEQTQIDGEYGPCEDEFQAERATLWMPIPEPKLLKATAARQEGEDDGT